MNATLADRMGFQWAGIEGAMKFANRNLGVPPPRRVAGRYLFRPH